MIMIDYDTSNLSGEVLLSMNIDKLIYPMLFTSNSMDYVLRNYTDYQSAIK